jgi:hypothetical protein
MENFEMRTSSSPPIILVGLSLTLILGGCHDSIVAPPSGTEPASAAHRPEAILSFGYDATGVQGKTVAFHQYCLGQVVPIYIVVSPQLGLANTTLHFQITQDQAGIVGVSLVKEGPFLESITVPVQLDANGAGTSAPFFLKGLAVGETLSHACSEIGCATAPGPLDITIVGLTSTELVALDGPLDGNPNAGGGQRVFPDKETPSGPVRNKVTVRATATPGATIIFKAFDVDDPSTDAAPVDPNGTSGNDNRGTPQSGTLSSSAAQADASGFAQVDLTVTMHPGDNFRVAGACDQTYLDGVAGAGTGLRDADGAPLPTAGAKSTDLLTVWRSFHVEVDHMGAVSGNQLVGAIQNAQPNKSKNTTVLTVDQPTGQTNRFEGGLLRIEGIGDFPVIASSRTKVTVTGSVAFSQAVAKAFTLVDDDDFNANDASGLRGDEGEVVAPTGLTFILMQDSDNPAENIYAAAYLRPRYDGGGALSFNGAAPFVLNILTEPRDPSFFIPQMAVAQNSNAPGIESDAFWVVYIQLAYQGGLTEDLDPKKGEVPIGGITDRIEFFDDATSEVSVPQGGQGSLAFLEDDRDADLTLGHDFRIRTAPHEIGHQFGLQGDDPRRAFGIMNVTGALAFVPRHLNVLRWRVKSPGQP